MKHIWIVEWKHSTFCGQGTHCRLLGYIADFSKIGKLVASDIEGMTVAPAAEDPIHRQAARMGSFIPFDRTDSTQGGKYDIYENGFVIGRYTVNRLDVMEPM